MGFRSYTVCKDCVPPDRHPGCHGTCEKYLEEKKLIDEFNAQNYKQRHAVSDIIGRENARFNKALKKRKK